MVSLVTLLTIGACIVVVICLIALAFIHFNRLEELYQCELESDKETCRQKHRNRVWLCLAIILGCVALIVLT